MRILVLLLFVLNVSIVAAQTGGRGVYQFLQLPVSAKATALGGSSISHYDSQISSAYQNPGFIDSSMHQQIAFNTSIYFAGINYGYAAYGHHFDKLKTTFNWGVQYAAYGKFTSADEFGTIGEEFKAGEYAINTAIGRKWRNLNYGVDVRFIFSNLESYSSVGITSDYGIAYKDTANNLSVSLVAKNVGTQLTSYDNIREPVAFDLQAGFSKGFQFVPFKIGIVAHNLHRWDIAYDDPNVVVSSLFSEEQTDTGLKDFVDNFFRHLIFNGELTIAKKLDIRFGYNHLRRKELSLSNVAGLSGFSFGFGISIKKIQVDYGFAKYHLAGSVNHFTLSTNLNSFKGRKN